ncbi:MAG: hypothetical protein ACP5QT_04800 [Brevinematia bacterium]
MIPLQTRIKIYLAVSIVSQFVGFISLFLIYLMERELKNGIISFQLLGAFIERVYIFVSILFLLSIIYGISIYFFVFKKGINKYKELKKRLDDLSIQEDFNLKSISFPEEDEFGDIGRAFSSIISKIEKYEELRTERLFVEFEKNKLLADFIDIPILFVSLERGEKIVRYYNETFEKIFAKKNEKEFYDIKNLQLMSLFILGESENGPAFKGILDMFDRMSEQEMVYSFIDKEFESAIDYAIVQKTKTTIKKEIRTINGQEIYKSDRIEIYPILDRQGNTFEVVIFFNKLKKVR